ncbi:MAG: hypothetical protein ABFS34_02075 [Gemmatimonadota bacterium]
MSLLWPTLAIIVIGAGVASLRRRRVSRGLTDAQIAAMERGEEIDAPGPLDLEEIADAERRHFEQTWDWEDPDAL